MSAMSAEPVVTCPERRWRGDWRDGYAVILLDAEIRIGIYRAQLEVHYHDVYVDTLTVDLLSSPARAAFSIALAARNGATPILWDKRLGDFYHNLHEAQRLRTAPVTCAKEGPLAPPLLQKATLATRLADGAAPWLEAYIGHSARWSPRAATHFHAAIGLWMLSTVAAGRIAVELGSPIYPSLNIALVSRSTLYAKTTTAKIGKRGLRQSGCGHLLAPERATPQALLRSMAGAVPDHFGSLDDEAQLACAARVAFAGQRGWHYEEWGGMLHQMTRKESPMAVFHDLIRWMDDGDDKFESDTIARGLEVLNHPYLALLCNATPHDLAAYLRPGAGYWHDGFWPRFAFVTPLAHETPSRRRQPAGIASLTSELVIPLQAWHQRLGVPKAHIEDIVHNGKPTGRYKAIVEPLPYQPLTMASDVLDAYYAYNDALLEMVIEGQVSQDLDASYGRFHIKALRIALLLASMAGGTTITLQHWAYAQAVAEQWRLMLHQLVLTAEGATPLTREEILEEKIASALGRHGTMTARDVSRHIRGYASREMNGALDAMVKAMRITVTSEGKTQHYALPVDIRTDEATREDTNMEDVPF
jgi:hypothetical protein